MKLNRRDFLSRSALLAAGAGGVIACHRVNVGEQQSVLGTAQPDYGETGVSLRVNSDPEADGFSFRRNGPLMRRP